ncbi:MAG: DNA polymerase III subunit delta [Balneolaceae bacterium]
MARPTSIDFYQDALKSIRDPKQRKPVYYFHGEETFFIDKLQDEIANLIPPGQKDFNFDLLYGRDCTPQKVLGAARSFPMMSEMRVVIVRDFLKLKSVEREDGELGDFENYVKNPNPSTILCLIDSKTPDGRTSFGKSLSGKNPHVGKFGFEFLPDYKLSDWVIKWAEQNHKKEIDGRAAQILAQLVGNNLTLLSTEIEKVCTFVDTHQRVELPDVKKIIGSYREYSAIELKEALFERNLEKSLGIAEQMLLKSNAEAGEVIRTVGFFYSVFSDVWQIRRLMEKGLNKAQIQSQLGVKNGYVFNFKWKDASQYQLSEMPRIFEALLDADRSAKGFTTLDTPSTLLLLIKRIIG